MGTPEFAVSSLDALIKAGCNIAGVITSSDKPAGRGMKMHEGAVKKYATEKNLNILQPEKLKDETFLHQLKLLKADVQVVVAFRMLPQVVWNMPPLGTINLHASLLPQYRGAAPVNRAIINGEKETGVTTFKLKHEIDTGNILLQEKISIGDDETAGELQDRMKIIGAELLVNTIQQLADGNWNEINQSTRRVLWTINSQSLGANQQSTILHYAPKVFTETCKIDWNKTADEIHNLIRGLSPYPVAFTFLNNKMLKIFRSKKEITAHKYEAGNMQTNGKSFLKFACSDGFIYLLDVQLQGRKRMAVEDFLRGFRTVDS